MCLECKFNIYWGSLSVCHSDCHQEVKHQMLGKGGNRYSYILGHLELKCQLVQLGYELICSLHIKKYRQLANDHCYFIYTWRLQISNNWDAVVSMC